jgi:hypothetical protein
VYLIEQAGGDAQGGGSQMAVSRYALDGRRLWAYRKTWTGFALDSPLYRPGYVIGAMKFCGLGAADTPQGGVGLVMVNGYHGQFNLLSDDGLWVAALASDNRFSPPMSEHTFYVENFSGVFFKHRQTGRHYYIAGETDTRIMEVTGLETIRRGTTDLVFREEDAARAREVAARRAVAGAAKRPLAVRRVRRRADGTADGYRFDEHALIDAGAGRTARFALGYDDTTLYAAFDVKDDSPLRNGGSDYALLFKTGDACDLMLAAEPTADPKRNRPVAGDLRLLLTETGGQPVAVLYEPVLRPGVEKAERIFSSPTGRETFARVVVLKEARVTVRRGDAGYRLEAAVPLAALGLKLTAGSRLLGDVGVLFGTPGGNAVGRRAYYFNQDTQITQDIPSEARLQPDHWGRWEVEP